MKDVIVGSTGTPRGEEKKICSRGEDYSQWYLDVIAAADLAEYGPSRGSMILKPYGYALWELIQGMLDREFKQTGVENVYFPMLIPEKLLKREADHVEGFSPEVAVVTYAGGKRLEEALVIRPTSETIMYDTFSRWIQSHRDLPLLINQWANVVRWEMRPRLFLRTTEFLWQEGHTAHATHDEAEARARMMLEVYRDFAETCMAIPVVTGVKSESEKFAGALRTYSLEAMMQDGKALQFATSHNLGQNFARAFDVTFTTESGGTEHVWQTSWGLSTRTIGALIMEHSDDRGLVLPPRMAPIQVVVTPIWVSPEQRVSVTAEVERITRKLVEQGSLKVRVDDRDIRPGEKYYHWEKRGVPLRLEVGPKDISRGVVVLVRRDTGEKKVVQAADALSECRVLLDEIQQNLFEQASVRLRSRTKSVETWDEFCAAIESGNFALAHWSGDSEDEAEIKEKTGATIRCLPFDGPLEPGICVYSGKPSERRVLFAKAY